MKLEFIEEGSGDCPLIRIFGSDPETCQRIKSIFEQLSLGALAQARIDTLPGIEPVDGCRLTASISPCDRGVNCQGDEFRWELTPGTWDNLGGLVEPFCRNETRGFQWLDGKGDVRVLLSRDGGW